VVWWLVATMTIGGLLSVVLKDIVQRARPVFDDPIAVILGYSFPSGHALNAMLGAGCLIVLLHPRTHGARRALLWAGAIAFLLLVGLDRIAIGAHFVSDVLAGWVIGAATVCATVAAFAVWRSEEGLPPPSTEVGLDPEQTPPED
jgi:undecaprenyl-diphosphatase